MSNLRFSWAPSGITISTCAMFDDAVKRWWHLRGVDDSGAAREEYRARCLARDMVLEGSALTRLAALVHRRGMSLEDALAELRVSPAE